MELGFLLSLQNGISVVKTMSFTHAGTSENLF